MNKRRKYRGDDLELRLLEVTEDPTHRQKIKKAKKADVGLAADHASINGPARKKTLH